MNDAQKRLELAELIQKELDGVLTDEEFEHLQFILDNDAAAVNYYVESILSISAFSENVMVSLFGDVEKEQRQEDLLRSDMWMSLAKEEMTAPAIPRKEPQPELIQKVIYPPREKRKLSPFSVFSIIASAAAVFAIVLFPKYAPTKPSSVEVATVVDQVDTVWASGAGPETGSRLWSREASFHLNNGILKIQYDDGVDVLIQGPAVFEVERSGLYLEYGRLYSSVSDTGLGFTVTTPTSQFVDQGTEFGVQADVNGSAELHVIKGKVQLFADLKGISRTSQLVTESKAVRYNANSGQVQSITVAKNAFVRNINSKTGMIWRGQTRINLGDIASGGDGLMTTRHPVSIHPNTGALSFKVEDFEGEGNIASHTGDFFYHPIKENAFVDGVFIPSIEQGPPKVTSAGHIFAECPSTSNTFWEAMFYTKYFQTNEHGLDFIASLGANKQNALFMHSNSGITFDLNKIRSAYSFGSIKEFHAACLLNRKRSNPSSTGDMTADFWVLVDAEVRYQKTDVGHSEVAYPIQFEISEQDQFLTLVVTDGSDNNASNDWGFFIEPVLVFQE